MGGWGFLVSMVVASLAVAARASRRVSDEAIARWSQRFDVVVDAGSRVWIASRLRRARVIRWSSFVLGVNLAAIPVYVGVFDPGGGASWNRPGVSSAPWFAATLGALAAELLVVQRPRGERSADVRRRQWSDYIGPGWIIALAACAPVAALAAVVATADRTARWEWSWVGPFAALVALATVTLGVGRIVARPALAAEGHLRLLDDALRADGAHHVVGASVALAGTGVCSSLAYAVDGGWSSVVVTAAGWLVVGCWYGIAADEHWNVAHARMRHV